MATEDGELGIPLPGVAGLWGDDVPGDVEAGATEISPRADADESATVSSLETKNSMTPTTTAISSKTAAPPMPSSSNSAVRFVLPVCGIPWCGGRYCPPTGPAAGVDKSTPSSPSRSSVGDNSGKTVGTVNTPPQAGHFTRFPANSALA